MMRFEVLWVVARHAVAACRVAAHRGFRLEDLEQRLSASLPRFGDDAILEQLLLLRGEDGLPPAAFDVLLDPDHPFRRAAVAALA